MAVIEEEFGGDKVGREVNGEERQAKTEIIENEAIEGKHEETAKEYTKVLELYPTWKGAFLRRADAREKLEQYDESIADLTKVLELDPSNDQARRSINRLKPLADEKREKVMKKKMIVKVSIDEILRLKSLMATQAKVSHDDAISKRKRPFSVSVDEILRLKALRAIASKVSHDDAISNRNIPLSPGQGEASCDVSRSLLCAAPPRSEHENSENDPSKHHNVKESSSPASFGKGHIFSSSLIDPSIKDSLWDVESYRMGSKLSRNAASSIDVKRLAGFSDFEVADYLGSDLARATASWVSLCERLDGYRKEVISLKESQEKLKTEYEARLEKNKVEIENLTSELKVVTETGVELMVELKKTNEQLSTEERTGARFLASEFGQTFIEKVKALEMKRYKNEEFETDLNLASVNLFDDVVRMCRRQMRETGKISEDLICQIEPGVSE